MNPTNEQLAAKAHAGDSAARDALILRTQGMVWQIARRYKAHLRLKDELADLVQAGNIGLARAVDLYQPERAKFSTYAWRAISQHVRDGLTVCRPIRLPRFDNAERAAANAGALQRVYDIQTIDAIRRPHSGDTTPREIADRQAVTRQARRLDDEETRIQFARLADTMKAVLTPRERLILELRHGIGRHDGDGLTLAEIGVRVRLTRERVRQIQIRATKKLRKAVEKTLTRIG